VCLGLSALGSVPLSPSGTGSIGAGPHLAYDTSGPRWAGPLTVRIGASYAWLYEEEAVFDGAHVGYRAPSSEHGVGGWLELTLQLRRRTATVAPVLGLNVGYTAVLTTDPVAHVLGGRVTLGLAVSRRLVFGDSADDEEPGDEDAERARDDDEDDDEDDEDDEDEDEEDDRRLREGADTLTGW
jgi:hypothetical protein